MDIAEELRKERRAHADTKKLLEAYNSIHPDPMILEQSLFRKNLQLYEVIVSQGKELEIIKNAHTDGYTILKLARRIWRDLKHCINELETYGYSKDGNKLDPEIMSMFKERSKNLGHYLGRSEDYRVALEKDAQNTIAELRKEIRELKGNSENDTI